MEKITFELDTPPPDAKGDPRSVLLQPSSRFVKFFHVLLHAVAWSVVCLSLLMTQSLHELTWFVVCFDVLCVCLGGYYAYIAVSLFFCLFNPRAVINVSSKDPYLGDELTIWWQFQENCSRITKLKIELQGHEMKYHGCKKIEDEIFANIPVINTTKQSGVTSTSLPANLRHSSHRKWTMFNVLLGTIKEVRWFINVRAEVTGWPDINDDYLIEVCPKRPSPL